MSIRLDVSNEFHDKTKTVSRHKYELKADGFGPYFFLEEEQAMNAAELLIDEGYNNVCFTLVENKFICIETIKTIYEVTKETFGKDEEKNECNW